MDPPTTILRKTFYDNHTTSTGSGPDSRTSQLFISYGHNPGLGKELWETPFGEVVEGMEHVEELYSYGDMPPWGKGPVQPKIRNDPDYIKNDFPLLDKFLKCTVEIHKPIIDQDEGIVLDKKVDVTKEQRRVEEKVDVKKVSSQGDDPVELKHRQNEAEEEAHKILGPFDDMMQLGAVCAGVIVVFLLLAAVTRRKGGKKKHAS